MTPHRRGAVLVLLAALAGVGASAAQAACYGTDATVTACVNDRFGEVDPDGGTISDCVHLGGSSCTPVSASYPTVRLYESDRCIVYVYLRGEYLTCWP